MTKYIYAIIGDTEHSNARESLYYVTRYIKQAENFDRYQKDIFDDEYRSTPTQFVRDLALQLIHAIEQEAGGKASSFSDEQVIDLLDQLTAVEDSLVPELEQDERSEADEFIAKMNKPRIGR